MQLSRAQRSPTRADVEKRLSLEGLSLGESPPTSSRHSSTGSSGSHSARFRLAPPDKACKISERHANVKSGSRRLSLPHTITERHGGRELWVRAPTVAGELEKRGFRWRRKWRSRYVELDGRELSYFALDACDGRRAKPKRRVQLKASGALEDVDALSFSVVPAAGEQPWVLRASNPVTKLRWCRAISDCFDILTWLQHYSLGAVLGVGGNGVVQELVDKRDGTKSAVKILDVAKFRNRDAVVAEVEILRNITNSIKHPNLMTIHKVYEEQGKIYIIQDLCTGGELYDAVVHRGRYSERDAARLMQQLMSALQALHRHNILHLDIKPENILLATPDTNDQRIVLTDFGLARMENGKQNPLENGATSMAGTIGYMAPEVITSHIYTEAADVFSAGVILFILLVGYPPFRGDSEVETLLKIARGDLQFDANDWAGVSMPAKELVARMLEVRAQDRITVDEVLAHPWMSPETVDNANSEPVMLDRAVERLQRFNYDRKSENMGSLMGSLLLTSEAGATEADYSALLDATTIDNMIRQLSPDGRDRIPLDRAHMLARGLGLSPFVDVQSFVTFLDQNHDGFIDAGDFCEGVRAMRSHDTSFASVIFSAYCKMVNVPPTPDAQLRRRHFKLALEQLECPEPLQKIFFRFVDDEEQAQDAEFAIDRAGLASLLDQFSFLGLLFLRTAKENVVSIVRSRSIDDMPRISEDSLSSP